MSPSHGATMPAGSFFPPAMRLLPLLALAPALGFGLMACNGRVPIHPDSERPHATHSEAPLAGNFPATIQPKLQAGRHWQAIAQDAAASLAQHLGRSQRCGPSVHPCRPLHVAEPQRQTEFSRAFINALITALVHQGVNVSRAPDAALVVHLDVQTVQFAANRPQYRHAGIARELGPGIWALQDVAVLAGQTPAQPAEADALHWFRSQFSAGATPRTEIVLTLSVMDGIRYAARSTNVYYVAESDLALYNQEICSTLRPCPEKAATDDGRPALPVRKAALSIVGDCPLDRPCCPPNQVCPTTP